MLTSHSMKKLWMSWSTGKDSAYALYELSKNPNYEITGLFTTVNEDYNRVAIPITIGEKVERDGFVFADVLPALNFTNSMK